MSERILETEPAHVQRNYILGIMNGAMGKVGMRLIDPHIVLTAFIYEMTRSPALVGLLSALTFAGALWPQLYMSSIMEHASRKKPFYVGALVARVSMLICLAFAMWFSGETGSAWWLAVFFVAYFCLRSAQGAGAMPFLDMVGQSIHPRKLGSFFAMRSLFGEAVALVVGFFVAQPILRALELPNSYVLLTILGTIVMTGGWGIWTLSHEEHREDPPERRNVREMLAAGWDLLRDDHNYRGLLAIRALMRINILTLVFYVPYGIERLGAAGQAGVFVGTIAASRLVSSPLWARLSNRRGNRQVLMFVAILFALSPGCALLAPRLPESFVGQLPLVGTRIDLPLCVYLLALCFMGGGIAGNIVGTNAFMLESAPSDRRGSYIAFLNTITFPLAFGATIVGVVLSQLDALRFPLLLASPWRSVPDVQPRIIGMEVLLGACMLAGLLTFLAAGRLRTVREEV